MGAVRMCQSQSSWAALAAKASPSGWAPCAPSTGLSMCKLPHSPGTFLCWVWRGRRSSFWTIGPLMLRSCHFRPSCCGMKESHSHWAGHRTVRTTPDTSCTKGQPPFLSPAKRRIWDLCRRKPTSHSFEGIHLSTQCCSDDWKCTAFIVPCQCVSPATVFRNASAASASLCCNMVKPKCTRPPEL